MPMCLRGHGDQCDWIWWYEWRENVSTAEGIKKVKCADKICTTEEEEETPKFFLVYDIKTQQDGSHL